MKTLWVVLLLALPVCFAATPAKEKAFVDAYKKAVETNNEAGLNALLYTKGSDPQALEFYKLMLTSNRDARESARFMRRLYAHVARFALVLGNLREVRIRPGNEVWWLWEIVTSQHILDMAAHMRAVGHLNLNRGKRRARAVTSADPRDSNSTER